MNHITKFSDVSRPGIICQSLIRVFRELQLTPVFPAVIVQKGMSHGNNFCHSFTKRGQLYSDKFQPVIKILPKGSVLHGLFQISVRCRHNTDIYFLGANGAKTNDFPILKHTKEFYLHKQWKLSYFIKKKSSMRSCFYQPHLSFAQSP